MAEPHASTADKKHLNPQTTKEVKTGLKEETNPETTKGNLRPPTRMQSPN